MKRAAASLAFGAILTLAPAAFGQSAVETHDGFFLSLATGIGFNTTSVGTDPEPSNAPDVSLSGITVGGHLAIGGTPAPGLVIGGISQGAHTFSPKVKSGNNEFDNDGDFSGNILGPFVDYYFDPNGGLHLQGVLGFATVEDGEDATDGLAQGFGLSLGLGHEWWVGEQWGIGVLGRVQFLSTSVELSSGVDAKYSTILPAVLFTATYH